MLKFSLHNKGKCSVVGNEFNTIREKFSVKNEGVRFAPPTKRRFIGDRIYAINYKGIFDVGLLIDLIKYCNKCNIKYEVEKGIFQIISPSLLKDNPLPELKLPLREYQYDISKKSLKYGRGVIVLATGGGKTLIISTILEYIYQNINSDFKGLVIVPDLGLVNQTYKNFGEYCVNFTSSKYTGNDELDMSSNVVISNMSILQRNPDVIDKFKDASILIFDEVHKLRKENKINRIIEKIPTNNKFGFTGTLPENKMDIWNIVGKIGPKIYDCQSFELQEKKYISSSKVKIIHINHNQYKFDKNKKESPYKQEVDYISTNEFRNKCIASITKNVDKNILILVDFLLHGETLYKFLCDNTDKKVFYINGSVEVKERQKIQDILEKEDNIIIVAISKIFSTGIDIKNLHYIMIAGGGKAKVKLIQSIGRGLRLHKNKTKLVVYDIADNLRYGISHSDQRKKIYDDEKIEFKETNIYE